MACHSPWRAVHESEFVQRIVNTSQRLDWGEYVAQMLRAVEEQESEGDIKYKVVERGGKLLEKMLTNINPTKSDNCSETDCVVCASPGGGWLCHKTRIAYKIQCNNFDAVYIAQWAKSGGHAMEFFRWSYQLLF